MCALKQINAAGAEEGAVNGSIESRGIYFPLGVAFLGSMVQPRLDREKALWPRGWSPSTHCFYQVFNCLSKLTQPPVAGTPKHTHLPLFFSVFPHWVRSSVTCHSCTEMTSFPEAPASSLASSSLLASGACQWVMRHFPRPS